jgi:leader peptidase (prepilin peptidase) / N-methyltransferase
VPTVTTPLVQPAVYRLPEALRPLVDAWESEPVFWLLSLFVFGAVVGSFLNVVALRLPRMLEAGWRRDSAEYLGLEPPPTEPLSLSRPASHCPVCRKPIRMRDNLPILGWLLLGGRCRDCRSPIPPRYPLVEIAAGLLAVAVGLRFGVSWQVPFALVLVFGLLVLTVIDIDVQLLPDDITQPLLWLGLWCALFDLFVPLDAAVTGAIAGYLSLWLLFHGYRLATGKEGMGFGDFKLLAVLGAWLGWQALPMLLLLSSLVGAVVGIALVLLSGRDARVPMPFGPFLAGAGLLCLLAGDSIERVWLAASGLPG